MGKLCRNLTECGITFGFNKKIFIGFKFMGDKFKLLDFTLHIGIQSAMLDSKACLAGKAFQSMDQQRVYFFSGDKMVGNNHAQ